MPEPCPPYSAVLAPHLVLIAEGHALTRRVLAELVQCWGQQACSAGTLREAVEVLDRQQPSSILLDLMLPDGRGAKVLRRVRERGLAVRVAVTTCTSEEQLLREVARLRPDAVYRKPLDLPAVEKCWRGL